jgi:hypothetical protein
MSRYIVLLVLTCLGVSSQAQFSISGQIIDKVSGLPVPGANVFVANSMVGIATDSTGQFVLRDVPDENVYIVVSHVAYSRATVRYNPSHSAVLIKLDPLLVQLNEIDVTAKEDKKWKRYYRKFEKLFLGTSRNASACTIRNPWVINLEKDEQGKLVASAAELIVIENAATGYIIHFLLEHFVAEGEDVTYSGRPRFETMTTDNPAVLNNWQEARRNTYLGSQRHFLRSLFLDIHKENGYQIYSVDLDAVTGSFHPVGTGLIDRKDCFSNDQLRIDKFLKVVYLAERVDPSFHMNNENAASVAFKGPKADLTPTGTMSLSSSAKQYQTSYLFSRKPAMPISRNGVPAYPEYLIEYGYWAWERVAELLPIEYQVE